jgi:AraC-like DNA-binding protein
MDFNLTDLLFVLVIFQLLFLSVFLFIHDKGKKIGNALLGVFFLAICLNLVDTFLLFKNVYFSYPSMAFWSVWILLLLGPLLFLYTKSVLCRNFIFSRRNWLHFIPFLLLFLFTEVIYLVQSNPVKLSILQDVAQHTMPGYTFLGPALIYLQFFLYTVASLRLIRQFRNVSQDRFSDRQRTNISWLSSTIVFFIVCMVISTANGLIGLTAFAKYFYFAFTLLLLMLFVFINRVLLKALQKPEIFAVLTENEEVKENIQSRFNKSYLVNEESKRDLERLTQHMISNKPYLEPELTLDELASQLNIRPKILSQLINEMLGQNFFDFINRYRIGEAQKLLTNPSDRKITVQEVLYQVGFNSKSSFNTLFKKYTGLTPSEFKRNQML